MLHWLQHNIEGRYAIALVSSKRSGHEHTEEQSLVTTVNFGGNFGGNLWQEDQYIGFEEPAEATMYAMFYK